MKKIEDIEIDLIHQSENSRIHYDKADLHELMSSLRTNGLLQPIGIHLDADKKHYHVVYGNRRLMAASKLGWKTIPCIVLTDVSEDEFLVKNLTENVQRKNLSLPEEGRYFLMLKDEKGLSFEEIAARVGVQKKHVMQAIDAFRVVPKQFRKIISTRRLGAAPKGHVPAMAALDIVKNARSMNKDEITDLFERVREGTLNAQKVARVTKLVRTGVPVKEAIDKAMTLRRVVIDFPMKEKVIERLEKIHKKKIHHIVLDRIAEYEDLDLELFETERMRSQPALLKSGERK